MRSDGKEVFVALGAVLTLLTIHSFAEAARGKRELKKDDEILSKLNQVLAKLK